MQTHRTKNPKVSMETLRRRIFGKRQTLPEQTWFIEIEGVKFTEEDFDNLEPIIQTPPVTTELRDGRVSGREHSPITDEFCEQFEFDFGDDIDAEKFHLPTP